MTSKNILPIDDTNFDHEVIRTKGRFLLDLGAVWCGPCKALLPIVERIADEHAGAVRVGKLDTEDSPEVARRLGVRAVPTLVVFEDGKEVARHTGLTSRERILALLRLDAPAACTVG